MIWRINNKRCNFPFQWQIYESACYLIRSFRLKFLLTNPFIPFDFAARIFPANLESRNFKALLLLFFLLMFPPLCIVVLTAAASVSLALIMVGVIGLAGDKLGSCASSEESGEYEKFLECEKVPGSKKFLEREEFPRSVNFTSATAGTEKSRAWRTFSESFELTPYVPMKGILSVLLWKTSSSLFLGPSLWFSVSKKGIFSTLLSTASSSCSCSNRWFGSVGSAGRVSSSWLPVPVRWLWTGSLLKRRWSRTCFLLSSRWLGRSSSSWSLLPWRWLWSGSLLKSRWLGRSWSSWSLLPCRLLWTGSLLKSRWLGSGGRGGGR